ncbi:MAG: hypothetical protein ACO2ZA_06025 [Litorivicinaceae bacterium]
MVRFNPLGDLWICCGRCKAGKEVKLLDAAEITPSGVIRLIELQEQGYAYIRP